MTLGDRIRQLIRESPFQSVSAFHREMQNVFEDMAVSRRALSQIINGHSKARERTLNQIAIILGVRTTFLRKGTEAELLEEEETLGVFTYNENASMRALANHLPFMPCKLVLKRGGTTSPEQDRTDGPPAVKWGAVIMGSVNLYINGAAGEEKRSFNKGATFHFDARLKHRFENNYRGSAVVYIIHTPAANSDFYLPPAIAPELMPSA